MPTKAKKSALGSRSTPLQRGFLLLVPRAPTESNRRISCLAPEGSRCFSRSRTDVLTADDKVKGDVIDREVPFPLSSRHFGGMRSSRRSLSSATHPSQEKWCTTLCPLSSSARAAAGTHRWATSTQAVSGLGVETRGESGLPSMNRGTPCSGVAALWD